MKNIVLRKLEGTEMAISPGDIMSALVTLNHDEMIVLCAVLGSYAINGQPTFADVCGLARLDNSDMVKAVIQKLIDKQYLKAENIVEHSGESVKPVLYLTTNLKPRLSVVGVSRMRFQDQQKIAELKTQSSNSGSQKEKVGIKKKNNIIICTNNEMSPASQDSSSTAAASDGINVQPSYMSPMAMGWVRQLDSTDKAIRQRAEKNFGRVCGKHYGEIRAKLFPERKQFYVSDKTTPTFALIGKMCMLNGVDFTEYIIWGHQTVRDWKESKMGFPTPEYLSSDKTMNRFINRPSTTQISRTRPNAFRTDLKNQGLPDELRAAGINLADDEIKFAEATARQRKLGIDVECPEALEAAVQWIMEHGCPDLG